jgi:hypothetical protein
LAFAIKFPNISLILVVCSFHGSLPSALGQHSFEDLRSLSLLLTLSPNVPNLSLVLPDLILKLSVMLPCSQKLGTQSNQAPTNRLVQDAPIQLLEGAQAAQIFIAQSSHVQYPHDL